MLYWPLCCEREGILSAEKFIPVTRAGVFRWENFHHGYRDWARPASHINISKFLLRKEWRGEISEIEPARLPGLM